MVAQILNKIGILPAIHKYRLKQRILAERKREGDLIANHLKNDCFIPLLQSEKEAVNHLWGWIYCLYPIDYREFEMFKKIYGFDARFLTHNNYLPIIARLLNDYRYTKIFDNKALLGYIKTTVIRFPECYVRCISKNYYDNGMRQISIDDAVEICSFQSELFLKPSLETSGGKGAKLLSLQNIKIDERRSIIRKELEERGNDFVVQECIRQHPVMAQFNPSSVNTLRITTLMLNGRFSICSIVLRCGKFGSIVDNWGAGGLIINVEPNGQLNSIAHDINLNEYSSNGNCVFSKCEVPQIPKILKLVEKCHSEDFAICKFIGWDIAIDHNGDPVILELNSSQPGVIGEQLVAGPIFGERTQEVIDYCKSKEFSY